jgi:hypothetical protein
MKQGSQNPTARDGGSGQSPATDGERRAGMVTEASPQRVDPVLALERGVAHHGWLPAVVGLTGGKPQERREMPAGRSTRRSRALWFSVRRR